ncbi:barstar family protein [Dyella subtropica]|uniref:barstar family protein n=1 Tax=Dyella subtropica TaxID=2992127 RepID=UPI002253CFD4|nr:barstar family protein [Dyella subtropica]
MSDQDNDTEIDLTDPARGGVFFVVEDDLEPLASQATGQALFVGRTSLKDCRGKDDLLRRLADSWQLPATFGHNWDALADCVCDFDWLKAPGYLLLFEHAEDLRNANEEDFDTLLDILDEAAEGWLDDNVPFFAFFALPEHAFNDPAFNDPDN